MKKTFLAPAALSGLLLSFSPAFADPGTAFTYQGLLTVNGSPANGNYDLTFAIFDSLSSGAQVGATFTNSPTAVNNGLFTVTLDFGAGVFTGPRRWLEIASQPTGGAGSFVTAGPRQELTPAPYAIFAANAGTATGVVGSAISAAQLNTAGGPGPGQVLSYDGTNLVWTTAGGGGGTSNAWLLGGNGGTTSDNFVGTTDNRPLEMRVNNLRALRLEPTPSGTPNVIGGSVQNFVAPGVYGATIGGGGSPNAVSPNSVTAVYGTVSGGLKNTSGSGGTVGGGAANSSGTYDTVSGGQGNTSSGGSSTVGGGAGNTSSGGYATVAGGQGNSCSGQYATVGGGHQNTSSGDGSFVGGGGYDGALSIGNVARGTASTVGGGVGNAATNAFSTVGGGQYNVSSGYSATVAGGQANIASDNYATVGGGVENNSGAYGTVAGGGFNAASGADSTVGGGRRNTSSGMGSVVGGGGIDSNSNPGNTASGDASTIAGGLGNVATVAYSTVGGGRGNSSSLSCTVAGGEFNSANGYADAIGGGHNNVADGSDSTVSGGTGNSASSDYATVGGGIGNRATAPHVVIGGGHNNAVFAGASVVGGGQENLIYSNAVNAVIGGGYDNYINESGISAVIPGGSGNRAFGFGSFAAGTSAYAVHDGSFVWGDGTAGIFSGGPHRFDVLATGGVGFYVNGGSVNIDSAANLSVTGSVSTCSLTIRGGCDVAEPFQMSSAEIPKGAVVVIDDESPGHLRLSDRAYDHRVAGIVSGANGINPGISLSQQGVLEGGQNVALSGRVYVLADATSGPIKPGDLLTTSDTPGHAMKARDHGKAQGAILGKAMSALREGQGMVLVLVSLQ